MTTIALSGGFDPLHVGHLRMIEAAAALGEVNIILNSDDWLVRKKGFFGQCWNDRTAILRAIRGVADVWPVDDADGTVCDALAAMRPDLFGNGGDRAADNTPELATCEQMGIRTVFGLGGDKQNASSAIARRAVVQRAWGTYEVLAEGSWWKVKRLVIEPGQATSMQKHERRQEVIVRRDNVGLVPRAAWHQLENFGGTEPLEMIEVQVGECVEADIVRDTDAAPVVRGRGQNQEEPEPA